MFFGGYRRFSAATWPLHRAVVRDDENLDRSTIRHWLQGSKAPRSLTSMEILGRIERRYRLPVGYFKAKLPYQARSSSGHILEDTSPAERRRLAWHLPDNFNTRSRREQEEILEWVRRVIISGLNRPGFAGGSNFQIGWSHDEQNDEQVFP